MKKLAAALALILLLALVGGCTPTELIVDGIAHPLDKTSIYIPDKDLGDSGIKDLRHAKALEYLGLKGNKITNISPLKNLTALIYLDVSVNNLESIQDLGKLTKLTQLNISDNNITDLGVLRELPNIMELKLSGNPITDISVLKEMTGLTHLECADTQLTDEQKEELSAALPNCDIWYFRSPV
ncbi:MAG: leucine-rich repeat domain-containing protein [Oscillospiraceae bacterium]|nr:leucine-rich repeat domain-containing protein [Oscillospiraceae bacterium]